MKWAWVFGMVCGGCKAPGDLPDPVPTEVPPPPRIVLLSQDCALEDGQWRMEIETDAWAGGGTLMWTIDGSYVELHDSFRSVKAAEDGTSDVWRLELTIVDDFRPAGTGGNTAFTCNDEVSSLMWIKGLDQKVADCRQIGPQARLLLPGKVSPACPEIWVPPPQDTDSDSDAPAG